MIEAFLRFLTLLSAIGALLVAGIFFAFSTFIMKALGRLPPAQGIAAMQSINVTVINPWFFTVFFGTAVACVILTILSLFGWQKPGSVYLLLGCGLYLVGTILVTIAFNVPRNDTLAMVQPENVESARIWTDYLRSWTFWNHIRTIAAVAAACSFFIGLRS